MKLRILSLLFLVSTFVSAETYRVPEMVSTIQAAIDSAAAGDTVLVAPGTYPENISFLGKQLVVASHFLTTGDTSYIGQTVIDGGNDTSTVSIDNLEPLGTQLTGFSITNGLGLGDWPNVRGGGINIRGGKPTITYCYVYNNETTGSSNRGAGIFANTQYALIKNCRVYNNASFSGGGITIGNGADGTIVDSCYISGNQGGGMLISYSSNVTIRRTVFTGNAAYGVRNFQTSTLFENLTISGNDGPGFVHSGTGSGPKPLEIVNTICYANTDSFDVGADSILTATYSIIENAGSKPWFGAGCLDTDPLFADTVNLFLSAASPAIDAGDPLSAPDPDATTADMGANYYHQTSSGIADAVLPGGFELYSNYPNPFNPTTQIPFQLAKSGIVSLQVFTITGQRVATVFNGKLPAGRHTMNWNGMDKSGNMVASGIYFYRLTAGNESRTRKMILVR